MQPVSISNEIWHRLIVSCVQQQPNTIDWNAKIIECIRKGVVAFNVYTAHYKLCKLKSVSIHGIEGGWCVSCIPAKWKMHQQIAEFTSMYTCRTHETFSFDRFFHQTTNWQSDKVNKNVFISVSLYVRMYVEYRCKTLKNSEFFWLNFGAH